MHIGKTQLIFIAGLVGVFVVSTIATSLVQRATTFLDRDARERVWELEARAMIWWRLLDIIGVVLMVAGVLRVLRVFSFFPNSWALPGMAAGLTIICISCSVRAWCTSFAYGAAAPGTSARRHAFWAAIVVSLAELTLAATVCWFVFGARPATRGGDGASSTGGSPAAPEDTAPREPAPQPLWVDKAEALKLLPGKDAAYLDALARRKDIRVAVKDGRLLYRRDDIVQMKAAGLPSLEELKNELEQKRDAPKAPQASPAAKE
ncbi:MAG: hypothetical protein NTW87_18525 [Planctomycetota bacterium]|nr:hypothetical protein [Planctomycetota bacterium]